MSTYGSQPGEGHRLVDRDEHPLFGEDGRKKVILVAVGVVIAVTVVLLFTCFFVCISCLSSSCLSPFVSCIRVLTSLSSFFASLPLQVVEPGMIGIVVTLGYTQAFFAGGHLRAPFISYLELMTAKTQLLEAQNVIPTKEGLSVELDTAVLFRINGSQAATLYNKVGVNYVKLLLEPEAASAVRGLTSESEAKALYTSGRSIIQNAVKDELVTKLGPLGIVVMDVLLKGIKLPAELTKSIELKAKAEQEAERMQFVLEKERKEAERKAIEARGIADFQDIVSKGISPELLQWKGIEATEMFAGAPNSKLIIMGNGGKSLPVLLSADSADSANSADAAPPVAPVK